ncbi:MAG: S8 family serine peptidase [Prevotella sp.]|nr:S8 family serine peptidase [Prevotella sp.]
MKRSFTFMLAALLMLGQTAMAQKVDQRLTCLASQTSAHRVQGKQISLNALTDRLSVGYTQDGKIGSVCVQAYLKANAECPTKLLEQKGITVRFVVDNVAVLSVPLDKVAELENIDEILFAKADELQEMDNDAARSMSNSYPITDENAATSEGLPQAYTGKGIVFGIIDGGIDFNHAAFRDKQGNTRIKRAVIFQSSDGSISPLVYNTPEEIQTLTTDLNSLSHGSHTLATAAGTELGNGYQGVAPEVDIMAVGMGQTLSESNMADGIRRVAQYAAEVGKPCVISMSMGLANDLHDGSSLVCKTVKELTQDGTKPGIAVFISSGNLAKYFGTVIQKLGEPRNDGWQLKGILGNDINLSESASALPIYKGIKVIAYAADGKDFTAELKIVNIQTGEVISNLDGQLYDVDGLNPKPIQIAFTKFNDWANGKGGTSVIYRIHTNTNVQLNDRNYRLAVFVKGTTGQTITMLNSESNGGEHNFFIPDNFADQGYSAGNNALSCNSTVCDDAVISVGSAVSRNKWNYLDAEDGYVALLGVSAITGERPMLGDVSDFSSYCNADDNGKPRPTLIAPGQNIHSAFNWYDISYFNEGMGTVNQNATKMDLLPESEQVYMFGRKQWYGTLGGTSMSTPHAAGIAALWMQAKPTLSVNEIKEVLMNTCLPFSAAQCPSKDIAQSGYGMIDALAGLKYILSIDGIDAISMNGHREATPATMYDVDAPVYNMLGQRVEKSQKGFVIYKGHKYLNK